MSLKTTLAAAAVAGALTIRDPEDLFAMLNPEQRKAAEHLEGPSLIAAVAGAGKTRVIVHRVVNLVKFQGVHPSRILAVTFSKKGADEMNERLEKMIGASDARIGTFHSLAYQLIRRECPEYKEWKVDGKNKYRFCIKDACGFRELDWKGADVSFLESFIGFAKNMLLRPHDNGCMALAQEWSLKKGRVNPRMMIAAYERAEELRRDKQLITFDDMIFEAVELLQKDESLRTRWASKWDYVIQDEAQDQNLGQLLIGELLARDHRNYQLVGDPAQCHPPGTMITTDDGDAPIEDLWAGQEGQRITVKGWNRNAQKMIGGRHTRLGSGYYDGPLFEMRVGERSVEMTDNHKVLCRWTDRENTDTCVTYLMYREGFGYRVGWCQLFDSRGKSRNFHLATRARLEKADRVWILRTHETRREASVYESIVAAKHGIPTATFEPVHNNTHLDTSAIAQIFSSVDTSLCGPEALSEHGRDVQLPFWPWPATEGDKDVAYHRGTYFPVHAINLLPELMSVPLPDDRNMWAPIDTITSRPYSGLVYSLDVEKDHSYAANGIVVLNCIYTWRGAQPSKLLGFEQTWGASVTLMGRNYRCGQVIIDLANKVLGSMDPTTRLEMSMVCEKGTDGELKVQEYQNLDDEGESIAERCLDLKKDGGRWRDMAVLYRTNAQSRAVEEAMIGARIPYRIIGGTNFYERREVKQLLSYLRCAAGTADLDDVTGCINAPFRFLGKAFVQKVRDTAKTHRARAKKNKVAVSYTDVVREACSGGRVQSRQVHSAQEWADLIENAASHIDAAATAEEDDTVTKDRGKPARILEDIVRLTRYTDWLTKDEGEESVENNRVSNVRELIRAAERFPTVFELLQYIKDVTKAASEQRTEGTPNKVTLTTLHRSKGLEWTSVFLCGVNDDILPHAKAEDIEEERRLFYVGVTRAKEHLSISCIREAAVGARVKGLYPSMFLTECGVTPETIEAKPLDAPPTIVS